jgi:hypothetical protein
MKYIRNGEERKKRMRDEGGRMKAEGCYFIFPLLWRLNMRITVNISDDLEKDIKKFAETRNKSISSITMDALEYYIKGERRKIFGNKVLDMVGKIKIDPNISKEIELWREGNHNQIGEGDEKEERHIWYKLGMKSLERVWNNDADAVYDNWRDTYNVPKR